MRQFGFALFAFAVFAADPAAAQTQYALSDFSGIWHRWFRPGLGPSASGPGPLANRSLFGGVSDYNQLVGDYTNPILKPQAAATVKQLGELSLKGIGYPTPSNQCWPSGVPSSGILVCRFFSILAKSPCCICTTTRSGMCG
jgi:hypothetical protein